MKLDCLARQLAQGLGLGALRAGRVVQAGAGILIGAALKGVGTGAELGWGGVGHDARAAIMASATSYMYAAQSWALRCGV